MTRFGLVACTKRKNPGPGRADDLYSASSLFQKAYAYCRLRELSVVILSAKYGAIRADTVIESYELTLKTMAREEQRAWGARTTGMIRELIPEGSEIELHCGSDYLRYLDLSRFEVFNPVKGLKIGNRMQWYDEQIQKR